MRTIQLAIAHAAVATLLFAGCGDDAADDDVTATDASAGTDAAANADAPQQGPDAGAADAGAADAGPDIDGGVLDPGGDHHEYVVDKVLVPTMSSEAMSYGLDIDGNDTIDNALGQILAVFVAQGLPAQTNVNYSIDHGQIIYLMDVQATDLVDAGGVGFSLYLGENPVPAPCEGDLDPDCRHHLDGTGAFTIVADSIGDNTIIGSIAAGHLAAGQGILPLPIPRLPGSPPLALTLVGARAVGDVDADGIVNGRLGGAVTNEEVDTVLVPAVHGVIVTQIEADCPDGICTPGSAGETLLDLFDDDMDGKVTLEEFASDELTTALFAPDLDLYDAAGDFHPRSDGVKDALSFGVAFTAVGATFPLPE